jgi:hypothetical protein
MMRNEEIEKNNIVWDMAWGNSEMQIEL